MWKYIFPALAQNLTTLLNNWLAKKYIPPEHTTSRLVLIPKKPINREDGNSLDEFRPIAVTSVLFKTLEVIVHRRVKALLQ
jgi:hypothetical protein